MASIDERVVAMSFENAKFEAAVAKTMATLLKLDATLKMVGTTTGLGDIDKAASKVTLAGPMSALEKLKARLGRGAEGSESFADIDSAANKVKLDGPMSVLEKLKARLSRGAEGSESFADIDKAANQVKLDGPISALDRLRGSFHFGEAQKGFSDIERAAAQVDLRPLNAAIDSVQGKFSELQVLATGALLAIAADVTRRTRSIVNDLSGVSAIIAGFSDYELKIGATQTIMAGTGESIGTVTKYLKDLDIYADRTIYNLRDMTSNIGKFTNAGVKLPVAVNAMKGIANVAALSGASAEEASRAMYNLGQAIGQGTVRLMDWRSVELANMGTKEFKQQLIDSAVAQGTLTKATDGTLTTQKGTEVTTKNFTQTLQDQWLTAEALTKTLERFADDNTEIGKKAYAAATNVKTFSMMMETLKAAAGTGWTDTFDTIIGDLPEATKVWTGLTSAIGGAIGKSADARNKVLKDWDELGGRKKMIEGIKNVFQAFGSVLKPFREAFREIFPKKTGQDLYDLTVRFQKFAESLKIGPETADKLRRTFAGFFAILDIGKEIVGQILRVIGNLFGEVGKGSGGFLDLTGGIGDFVVSVRDAIKEGSGLTRFFDGLGKILAVPIKLISSIASALSEMFGGSEETDVSGIRDAADTLTTSLSPLSKILEGVGKSWDKFTGLFDKIPFGDAGQTVADFVDSITEAFAKADYEKIFSILETTFIGGIFLALRKGLKGGLGGVNFNLVKDLSPALETLTGSLKAMQQNLKADTLMKIAIAVGVLAAGVFALSLVDSKKLAPAMATIAAGLASLMGAMSLLARTGGGGKAGFITAPIMIAGLAASLVLIAGAATILSVAMLLMSRLDWEEIAKGLTGIGGGLLLITGVLKKVGPVSITSGAGLLIVAGAMILLATAMKIFATMSWEEIAKGLAGVGGGLTAIAATMRWVGGPLIGASVGLVAVAGAMILLATAMKIFATMSWEEIGKGLVGVGGGIVAIGLAFKTMPGPVMIAQAIALNLVALALVGVAGALKIMGSMSIEEIAKSILTLNTALVVLSGGLKAMVGTLPGSASLLVAAGAFAVLAPTIAFLGQLKIFTLVKGLVAMAGALAVLAIAGKFASPGILALGIALIPLAAAFFIVTSGVYILAKGLSLLGEETAKSAAIMVAALTAFVAVLPTIVIQFLKGMVEITAAVAKMAPTLIASFMKIFLALVNGIVVAAPRMAVAVIALIESAVAVIIAAVPKFIEAGAAIIVALLTGVANNIGKVITQGANIIVNFLEGMSRALPRILAAGARALVTFIEGIVRAIPQIVPAAAKAIVTWLVEITKQLPKIVDKGVDLIVAFLKGIAKRIDDLIHEGATIVGKVIRGIGNELDNLIDAGIELIGKFIKGIAKGAVALADAAFDAMIIFLEGLAAVIRDRTPELIAAGADVGLAIVEGIVTGLAGLPKKLADKLIKPVKDAVSFAGKILDIGSPSKVFVDLGQNIVAGMSIGLNQLSPVLEDGVLKPLKKMVYESKASLRDWKSFLADTFGPEALESVEDVANSFDSLSEKIQGSINAIEDRIEQTEEQLKQLRSASKKDKDWAAIRVARKALEDDNALLVEANASLFILNAELSNERTILSNLANSFESISDQLAAAESELQKITQTRDDAIKSFTTQYSTLPGISSDKEIRDKVGAYKKALKDQIIAVEKYMATLQRLRELGLDDATYQKLLTEGTAGQEFASQLVKGGAGAVAEINALDARLLGAATGLANQASANLYNAGVAAAQGLVNGLLARQAEIQTAMNVIAGAVVSAILKALGIKSPSRVLAEIGKFAAEGLVQGFKDSTKRVADAAVGMGDEAVSALSKTLAHISDTVNAEIDTDLTITPILDLSQVKKQAGELADLTNVTPITAAASYGQAASISSALQELAERVQAESATSTPSISLEQHNHSPEALSEVEIYRQTRNLMSQAKTVLAQ